jgi:hypothetical protein
LKSPPEHYESDKDGNTPTGTHIASEFFGNLPSSVIFFGNLPSSVILYQLLQKQKEKKARKYLRKRIDK